MKLMPLWTTVVLYCCATGALALQAGKQKLCPNRKASEVGKVVHDLGAPKDCAPNPLAGPEGSGPGWMPQCPSSVEIVPAHGECLGEAQHGKRCVPAGVLAVERGECACHSVDIVGPFVVVTCLCSNFRTAGTVENFATADC